MRRGEELGGCIPLLGTGEDTQGCSGGHGYQRMGLLSLDASSEGGIESLGSPPRQRSHQER